MVEVEIPGYGTLVLNHVVMDYNGTLAVDGVPVDGVDAALKKLSVSLELHVLTADTFGKAAAGLEHMPCGLSVLPPGNQAGAKRDFVTGLGSEQTAAIGNGRNDRLMLEAAGLGICVLLEEGAAIETLNSADVLCPSILSALELLANPLRLKATLRS
ncbi:MAG: HAD hydrolase family protein [Desulfobacteraceae bacterium]|nr:HAD hydrolase family protein [Desulfobacteraceae bacterium]